MSNTVTPEMIRLLNGGDQRELRAFLTLYARPVYERALSITRDEADAKRVTRRVISETALLAAKGALEEDVDAQLMRLTDACCSEDIFFAKLVDDTMKELASCSVKEPDMRAVEWNAPATAPEPAQPTQPPAEEPHAWDATPSVPPGRDEPTPAPAYVSGLAVESADGVPDLFAEEDELDAEDEKKPGPLIVVLIFTLALATVALVWVLLVKLMCLNVIPKFDFGFAEWFNTHVFLLY